ncbi:S66 peptidase family protein [Virgibacillus sp. 7505]|uniref:S66 family peptidase n=1 Tax=Virgibacillus sp. 7505 TaxID=2022548 RepID=UPI0015958F22|nr:S66 peptidase family protein [Virgibacillus sp. 7505]
MMTTMYPSALTPNSTFAITAPSSGVPAPLHSKIHKAKMQLEKLGAHVIIGETVWTQQAARSSSAETRAHELMAYLSDPEIDAIMPPWGGELLVQVLPMLDWDKLSKSKPTWLIGYSDTSTLLCSYTLQTNFATAHTTNFFDLNMEALDETTKQWHKILSATSRKHMEQHSSPMYQSSWDALFDQDNPEGFDLDSKTEWKTTTGEAVSFTGRLIGGCLNTLTAIAGTKYAPIQTWRESFKEDTIVYLEWLDWSTAETYRNLWHLKEHGWFNDASGLLFGRPSRSTPSEDYTDEQMIHEFADEIGLPIIYDADIGHMPPQFTMINGALANVSYKNGKGTLTYLE